MADKEQICVEACFQVKDLAKRVEKMEVVVADLRTKAEITDVILNRVENAFVRNTEVVSEIKDTLINMQGDIKINASLTGELKDNLEEIKNNFKESEEKSKIDIRVLLKEFFGNKFVQIFAVLIILIELLGNLGAKEVLLDLLK